MFMTMHRLIFTALLSVSEFIDEIVCPPYFSPAVATIASTPGSLAIQESPLDSVESTEDTAKSNNLPTIGQLAPDSLFLL
ncbi:unnamed protein product [Sphagnum balticum]